MTKKEYKYRKWRVKVKYGNEVYFYETIALDFEPSRTINTNIIGEKYA